MSCIRGSRTAGRRPGDRVAQLGDRRRRALGVVVVLVVGRDRLEARPRSRSRRPPAPAPPRGGAGARCASRGGRCRGWRGSASRSALGNSSSTMSRTSLASAWSPPGSSICQTIPKAVRSIVASSESGELLDARGELHRAAQAAGGLDRQRDACHRELARDVAGRRRCRRSRSSGTRSRGCARRRRSRARAGAGGCSRRRR